MFYRLRETALYYKNTSSISFVEPNVNGYGNNSSYFLLNVPHHILINLIANVRFCYMIRAAFAFKPKDIEHKKIPSNSGGETKLTESDIKQKITRLSTIYSDTVSKFFPHQLSMHA